jgi:formate hydrogenlyase transcriptional activator
MLTIPARVLVEQRTVKFTSRLTVALRSDERRMIEQALEEADGRVAGSAGAAARLGVPASTLESKIKRFSIDKLRYRAGRS